MGSSESLKDLQEQTYVEKEVKSTISDRKLNESITQDSINNHQENTPTERAVDLSKAKQIGNNKMLESNDEIIEANKDRELNQQDESIQLKAGRVEEKKDNVSTT